MVGTCTCTCICHMYSMQGKFDIEGGGIPFFVEVLFNNRGRR